ncbi:MAG TPA: 50S ribosomal protein L32 [Thermotogota bacterium]|nr:50S ribosomal protein L32 [Thermotogota bacterium]HRW91905.1 50S ribosomal protein L32 [Thermotogota bacterium]
MAVPTKKSSRCRTGHRRAKIYRAVRSTSSKCPNCGEPKLPHRVCLHCGYYSGKQVIEFEEGAE